MARPRVRMAGSVKPETEVKNYIEQGILRYLNENQGAKRVGRYETTFYVTHPGSPEKDFSIIIHYHPACPPFACVGAARLFHPHLGVWQASLNGTGGMRVGKPKLQWNVDEMKDMVRLCQAKALWPELGY